MSFFKLAEILKKIQDRNPALKARVKESQAIIQWEEAVGPAIAKHSKALRVQDGILWVEVDHPIWKSELHHRKRQILDLLNSKNHAGLKDLFLFDKRTETKS